jgi:hypothetical protein
MGCEASAGIRLSLIRAGGNPIYHVRIVSWKDGAGKWSKPTSASRCHPHPPWRPRCNGVTWRGQVATKRRFVGSPQRSYHSGFGREARQLQNLFEMRSSNLGADRRKVREA